MRRVCSSQRSTRRRQCRRRRRPLPRRRPPLRVYIHAGLKTHAEGQHDYPQFLADWSKLLTNRGAIVDGGLHFPSARELADVDVMVIYKGDAGYLSMEDRATLDSYLRRGGGLVSLHDALCGPSPEYFSTILGGAKKHGEVNYTLEADVPYTIADPAHPIMQGMTDFTIKDEAFFLMTWAKAPEINVLATAPMAATPSAGTHTARSCRRSGPTRRTLVPGAGSQPYRAFVWMQGHNYANFAESAGAGDAAARHRLGRQASGRRADDRAAATPPVEHGDNGSLTRDRFYRAFRPSTRVAVAGSLRSVRHVGC